MGKMISDRLIGKAWSRLLIIVITLVIMLQCTTRTALADTFGDYEYTVNPDGISVSITGYTGSGGDITIPDNLDGKTVTKININAFRYNTTLKSVTLSNNITYLGAQSFEKCTNLENVVLSNSLEEIDVGAFRNCSKLKSIDLPGSLRTINNSAFAYSGLIEITIPANVDLIDTLAFGICNDLINIKVSESNANYKSVDGVLFNKSGTELLQHPNGKISTSYTIPDGIIEVGQSAFSHNQLLEEVIFPNSLTTILTYAFSSCSELKNINIPSNVTSIGDSAFGLCKSFTSLILPDSVESIGRSTFYGCDSITSITLSNNLTNIGENAFSCCSGFNNITIPASVENIGSGAFSICFYLTEIIVDEGNQYYKSIDGALFDYNVTNLILCLNDPERSSYEIPVGVLTISDGAFDHCVFLDNIIIPNTVTTIANGAFERCNVETINIPASVTSMAESTFEHCTELKEINVDTNNPYFSDIDGVLFNKAGTRLLQYTLGSEEVSYTVPDGVTKIVSSAFQFNILETITLPSSLSSIEGNALNECTHLKEIVVDESNLHYSSNGGVLFNKAGTILYQYPRAKANPNYIVPNDVTNLGYHSFYEVSHLQNIYIPAGLNSISSSAFSDFFHSFLGTIYGESGSYAESYADSKDINFIAGELVMVSGIELDKETLFLRPGETVALTATVYPQNALIKDIIWSTDNYNTASVSDGVVTACPKTGNATITATTKDGRFIDTCEIRVEPEQCSVYFNTDIYGAYGYYGRPVVVDFGSSIPEPPMPFRDDYCFVGWYPTRECDTVPISFPYTPTEPEERYYAKWESPDFNGSYGEYDYWVKKGEATITGYSGSGGSVKIPSTLNGYPVTAIGSRAFKDNTKITNVTIQDGVTSIGIHAFAFCTNLEGISIPNSVNTIGMMCFESCISLKSAVLPCDLTLIDYALFYNCYSLSSVNIPDGVTAIEGPAFASSSLERVILPENLTYLGGSAFARCSYLSRAYFNGDVPLVGAPNLGMIGVDFDVFDLCDSDFTVCYLPGATGFTNPWRGYPTRVYDLDTMLESSMYSINRTSGYLNGVAIGTSASELKQGFMNDGTKLKVFDEQGIEYSGEAVATGMTVKLFVDSDVKDELTICILGDINGDGKISITDYTLARLDILGLKSLAGVFNKAGDINEDGKISITDYTLMRLDILGLKSIH